MNIIFLHIPKTAGQSIHHELQRLYSDKIAPVRINSDLDKYSNNELEKFNVFSGHLDWNRLKFLPNPFTFTILRDPIERICSFYIYLEEKAKRTSKENLALPQNTGLKLISTLSIDEYFCKQDLPQRKFIDNHFNNFYSYFFASGQYNTPEQYKKIIPNSLIVDIANKNLSKISLTGNINNLNSFTIAYRKLTGEISANFNKVNTNSLNSDIKISRLEILKEKYNPTAETLEKLESHCLMDNRLSPFKIN